MKAQAENYKKAIAYLDSCGGFTLDKLREAHRIAGVNTPESEIQQMWNLRLDLMPSAGKPGGAEALREIRREKLTQAIQVFGSLDRSVKSSHSEGGANPAEKTPNATITVTKDQITAIVPSTWTSKGTASPDDPLTFQPNDSRTTRQISVSVIPASTNDETQATLLASLRQFARERSLGDPQNPQTGTCSLGHFATARFSVARSGRTLWLQLWHSSNGRIKVMTTHTAVGTPSDDAIAETHKVVLAITDRSAKAVEEQGQRSPRSPRPQSAKTVAPPVTQDRASWWQFWKR